MKLRKVQVEGLSMSTYHSIRRATKNLIEGGRLLEIKRPFSSLHSINRHYPFATRSLVTLRSRRRLLPKLFGGIDGLAGFFSNPGSEEHVVRHQLQQSQSKRDEILSRWQELEPQLIAIISEGAGASTEDLVALLVRGRQLFGGIFDVPWSVKKSFGGIVDSLSSRSAGEQTAGDFESALQDAINLSARAIPAARLTAADLKSKLYHVVDFSGATASLKMLASWSLVDKDPKLRSCILRPDKQHELVQMRELERRSAPKFTEEGHREIRSLLEKDVLRTQAYIRRA